MSRPKYLKHPATGRVLVWTQILAERGDMVIPPTKVGYAGCKMAKCQGVCLHGGGGLPILALGISAVDVCGVLAT